MDKKEFNKRLEKIGVSDSATFQMVKDSLDYYFIDFEKIEEKDFLDFVNTYLENGTFNLMDNNDYKTFFQKNYSDIFDFISYARGNKENYIIKTQCNWLDEKTITNCAINILLEIIYNEVFFCRYYKEIEYIF